MVFFLRPPAPSVTICSCLGDLLKWNLVSLVVELKGWFEIMKILIQMSTILDLRMRRCQASTFMILRKSQLTLKKNLCRLSHECKISFISRIKWHLLKSILGCVAGVTMCQDKPLSQNLGMLKNICLESINYLNYSFTGAERKTAARVKPAKTVSFRIPRHGLHLVHLCSSFSLFISLLIICQCSPSLAWNLVLQTRSLRWFKPTFWCSFVHSGTDREINRASK